VREEVVKSRGGGGDIAAGKMVVGGEWQAMATRGGHSLNGVGARSKGC
jgi:hypothetical protein